MNNSMMFQEDGITRRAALGVTAGICFGFVLPSSAQGPDTQVGVQPNAWIRILPDDTVIIYSAV